MSGKGVQESNQAQGRAEGARELARRDLRRNQVTGVVAGLIGAVMTGNLWPAIPPAMPLGWGGVLAWGAAIGAILGSLPQLARAGKLLTRSDNALLNGAAALSAPLLLILLLALVLGAFK